MPEPGGHMLDFEYSMELDFGETPHVTEHAFTLRCLPQESASQHIKSCEMRIEPAVVLSYGTDAFGTRYCYGLIHHPHKMFRVEVKGRAERYPDRYESASPFSQMLYRQPTPATAPGELLTDLYNVIRKDAGYQSTRNQDESDDRISCLQRAYCIRDLVHSSMKYVTGATAPFTKAEQAVEKGEGVCQDYAHIMLALCRMDGIPCRYTAGLLLGEGTSHAWVEICDGEKWVPVDPTNPDVKWDEQLIFSHGRDARDCEINRGVYLGPRTQQQKVAAQLTSK